MIFNSTKNSLIADKVTVADSFPSRMIGLLNHSSLGKDEALIITHCNSIHMFFMRFSIDVIFLDGKDRVVGLVQNIRPFCLSPVFWNARCAIELPCGTIAASQTAIGDSLRISDTHR